MTEAAFNFEGDEVTDFAVTLPSSSLDAPQAFPRGTLLTLQGQYRVKSVRLEEDRHGKLVRRHVLVLDEATITDILTPERRRQLIEEAEQAALRGYTVKERDEVEDVVIPGQITVDEVLAEQAAENGESREDESWATGSFPVDTNAFTEETEAAAEKPVVAADDDDAEHSWMDEDDESGVHVQFVDNKSAVGF